MLIEVINTWIIRSINIPQNIKYLIKKGEINRLSNLEKDFLRLQLFRIYFYSNGNDTNFKKHSLMLMMSNLLSRRVY